jgi:hypothetical protein
MHRMSYDDGFKDGVAEGIASAQDDLLVWLYSRHVLRESMIPGFWVIYTMDGPIDIKPESLLGPDWKIRTAQRFRDLDAAELERNTKGSDEPR